MRLAEFKRVKHGQLPGDISKHVKVAYREHPTRFQHAKTFNRVVKDSTRVQLRERLRRELKKEEDLG